MLLTYQEYNILNEEKYIIKEIDKFIYQLNENLISNIKDKSKKLLLRILNIFNKSKNITKEFIDKVTKFIFSIIKKLKPEKKEKIEKEFNMLIDHIGRTISGNVDKEMSENAVEDALNIALKKGLLNKDNLTKSFKDNKEDVINLIKEQLSKKLDNAKNEILKNIKEIDEKVNNKSNILKKITLFASGTITMLIFGLVDNLGLFVGMGGIEKWITELGFDSQVSAGFGNTFSDALGAILGGVVMSLVYKITKQKGEGTTSQQVIGVTIGCLLPVFGKMLFAIL